MSVHPESSSAVLVSPPGSDSLQSGLCFTADVF